MYNWKLKSVFASKLVSFAAALGIATVFASVAHAGPQKTFGAQWAWDNNFGAGGNSAISATFGNGSNPSITVSYNFSSFNLYGYPACIRGWHYGANPTGDTLFPMQMSQATSIPCTFSYSSSGTNMAGDFAYDMFLRFDNSRSTPQLEVMVWGGNASYPIGSQTGTNVLSAGGWTFDLWEGNNSSAGYYVYTFIPHGTAGSPSLPTGGNVNVDMKPFFNWLQANRSSSGHYNDLMYLDVVEAGLEVTRGNGTATMTANISASTGGGGGGGTTIIPYVEVNGGAWNQTLSATLAVGGSVSMGPQPASGGSWSWSGPNGFSSNSRQVDITNIQTTQGGNYVTNYTNTSGAVTHATFTITVTGGGGGGGPVTAGTYQLINRANGLALDNGGSTADGANVNQWTSIGGNNNQRWQLSYVSGTNAKLTCVTGGKCLDSLGHNTDGSTVGQWTSSGSTNQQWTLQSQGGGWYKIINNASGKALDTGGATSIGAVMVLWTSGVSFNQQWRFQ